MNPNRLAVPIFSTVAALALALPSPSQEQVPLGFGVPADAHFFVHGMTTATPDPAMARMERAFAHLGASRVHEDVLDLVTMEMPRGQAAAVRAGVVQALEILGRADWATLMAREVVFAERIAMPMPEYLMIFRVPSDQVQAQLAGIRSMLTGLVELADTPELSIRDIDHRSGPIVELAIEGAPIQLAVGAARDAIVLSTSTQTTVASMRGLLGDGSRSIVGNERFNASRALLPEGGESTSFIDMAGLFDFMSGIMGMAEAGVGGDPEAAAVVRLVRAVMEELDIVDHMLITASSDGSTVTNTALIKMRDGYEASRIVELTANQQPWTDWHRYVPADATSFVFDTGLDVGGLFDLVESVAAESFGDGQSAPWSGDRIYREVREKAGYVSGELASITLPAAAAGSSDNVTLLRLEKTEGVAGWIEAHLQWIGRFLESKGQKMTITPHGELFAIELAAFPWIRPVVGVRDGFLVVATSADALARVDRAHDGRDPDIRSSARFAGLGVGADGTVAYVDYAQLESGMGDLANVASAAGFVMSLLPEDRDTRPMIKLGAILTKLAPAMRELEMTWDLATEMRGTGEPATFLSRSVARYRDAR